MSEFNYNLDIHGMGEVSKIHGLVRKVKVESIVEAGIFHTIGNIKSIEIPNGAPTFEAFFIIMLRTFPEKTTEPESRIIEAYPSVFIVEPFIRSVEMTMELEDCVTLEMVMRIDKQFSTLMEAEVYLVTKDLQEAA